MSSANISAGPASCMKFNSSFLYYVGFFILLVVGYMWGKRNGTKEERKRDAKGDSKKTVESEDSEKKPIKGAAVAAGAAGAAAVGAAAVVASKAKSASKKAGSSIKSLVKGKKKK